MKNKEMLVWASNMLCYYYHPMAHPKNLAQFHKFVEDYIEPPAMDYKHSMKFEADIEFKDGQNFYAEVYVEYSYSPEQEEIINPPDDAQQGFDESVEIDCVRFTQVPYDCGIDISNLITDGTKDMLAEMVLEEIRSSRDNY